MKKIRVGVVGCGVIAPTHIESYLEHPDVEVAWVCDLQKDRLDRVADKYRIPNRTTDSAVMFADPELDAVSVCTGHAAHVRICEQALAAEKDVLCEKALAATKEGLDRILAAAAAHPDRIFSGVFQHRYNPTMRYIRDLVNAGEFGKPLTVTMQHRCIRTREYYKADAWRGTWNEEGGSVLINQAIHFLDLFQWMMGGVDTIAGFYSNLTHTDSIETEDTVAGAVRFKNGALGTIEATTSSNISWETTLEIHGTSGSVEIRDHALRKVEFSKPGLTEKIKEEYDRLSKGPAITVGKAYYGYGHPSQIADFVECVRTRAKPFVTAQDAAETVRLVLALYKSHRLGAKVTL